MLQAKGKKLIFTSSHLTKFPILAFYSIASPIGAKARFRLQVVGVRYFNLNLPRINFYI